MLHFKSRTYISGIVNCYTFVTLEMSESNGDRVFNELRRGLLNGDFGEAGSGFLTVRELCARFGIAHNTGFRVMSRLHGEGLIVKSGRAYKVLGAGGVNEGASEEGSATDMKKPVLIGFLATCLESPYFAKLAAYAEDFANSIGASLVIASSNYDFEKEKERLNMFCQHGVSGILVCPWASTPEQEAFYGSLPVPCVMVGRSLKSVQYDSVLVDNYRAGREVARHLVESGAGCFAYVGQSGKPNDSRLEGFRAGLLEAGHSLPDKDIFLMEYANSGECNFMMYNLLLRKRRRRLGVFCYHDLFALRLLNLCHSLNIKVTDEVAVVGFDDLPIASECWPPLTSVSYPVREMAQLAFEALYSRIRLGIPDKGFTRFLDTKLMIRQSTRTLEH